MSIEWAAYRSPFQTAGSPRGEEPFKNSSASPGPCADAAPAPGKRPRAEFLPPVPRRTPALRTGPERAQGFDGDERVHRRPPRGAPVRVASAGGDDARRPARLRLQGEAPAGESLGGQ